MDPNPYQAPPSHEPDTNLNCASNKKRILAPTTLISLGLAAATYVIYTAYFADNILFEGNRSEKNAKISEIIGVGLFGGTCLGFGYALLKSVISSDNED